MLVTLCDTANERMGLRRVPLADRHRWTVGSPKDGERISLASWEIAVRHGEVASSVWPRSINAVLKGSRQGLGGNRKDGGATRSTLWTPSAGQRRLSHVGPYTYIRMYVCMQRQVSEKFMSALADDESSAVSACRYVCWTCFTPDRRTLDTPYRSPTGACC